MRKAKKIFWVLQRKCIKLFNYFSPGLYMKYEEKYLQKIGINLRGGAAYIDPTAWIDGADYTLFTFGKDIVISKEVVLLTHDYSISRGLESIGKLRCGIDSEAFFLKPVTVGDNCFIGARAILLPGTILGDNVIVGAGAVVSGSIPSDSLVVGNPAKVICNTKEWALKKFMQGEYHQ